MTTKLLACETLKSEIETIIRRNHLDLEPFWIESGLHNMPKKLHGRLQEELDSISGCQRLLLGFGRCGNSVLGLKTGDYETIFPRIEDCISLFFGSDAARNAYGREHAAIYMTEGWLRGESNLFSEYQNLQETYGPETADELISMMYGNYRELALLDTGTCPIRQLYEKTAEAEKILHLKRVCVPATLEYLQQLLTGPWDEKRFCRIPPHSEITI